MSEPVFEGGWSYTQREMNELFKHLFYKDKTEYKVLEFGSGNSTIKLYDYFKQKVDNVIFYSYESESNFLFSHDKINLLFYDKDNIKDVVLPNEKFDLILIDGPNGDKRSLWYSKIRNNVKEGTIILIDDFNHYKCFSDELDRNFNYELLNLHDEPFVAYGEHSWKIAKIINPLTHVLYIQSTTHAKNHHAIMNYKNIQVYPIYDVNQLNQINLSLFDCVFSPCCPIDVSKYPNTKFLFGPHFSIFPENSLQMIKGKNSVYNLLSEWVKDVWVKKFEICNDLRLVTFPFGVDTEKFSEIKPLSERNEIMVYCKNRSPLDICFIQTVLSTMNINYKLFSYHDGYNEDEYISCLQKSRFCIWVDAHESQGFALQEALSCNVPLLVWNISSMADEYNSNYPIDFSATTTPYWDERCGEQFYHMNEFDGTFKLFLSKLDTYKPREYIMENLSIAKCEEQFIKNINNI